MYTMPNLRVEYLSTENKPFTLQPGGKLTALVSPDYLPPRRNRDGSLAEISEDLHVQPTPKESVRYLGTRVMSVTVRRTHQGEVVFMKGNHVLRRLKEEDVHMNALIHKDGKMLPVEIFFSQRVPSPSSQV